MKVISAISVIRDNVDNDKLIAFIHFSLNHHEHRCGWPSSCRWADEIALLETLLNGSTEELPQELLTFNYTSMCLPQHRINLKEQIWTVGMI
jgi:hypothetical protein